MRVEPCAFYAATVWFMVGSFVWLGASTTRLIRRANRTTEQLRAALERERDAR